MLIGRELENKIINRLQSKNLLFGGFLFFGEPQIGKFTFADILTRSLEENSVTLQERVIIRVRQGESAIGIDDIRLMKSFLRKRPAVSEFRSVIIDQAEKMTVEAQNATLKIIEEPPPYALIIFIARNTESLLPTLVSRLKKIYFAPVKEDEIKIWLIDKYNCEQKIAEQIAKISFGKPGFALELLQEINRSKKTVIDAKMPPIPKKFDSMEEFDNYIKIFLAKLYNNKDNNWISLKIALKRMQASARFNTNKKLQLQSIPWTH